MPAKEVELFRNVSVHEFYRLSVDYFGTNEHFSENLDGEANFGTSEYFSGRKKRNVYEQTSAKLRQ